MNIHCEFSSRFHSDSKRIRSGFESKRHESPRIHNVFVQQYGFANFGRAFTVIRCETLSWVVPIKQIELGSYHFAAVRRLRVHSSYKELHGSYI